MATQTRPVIGINSTYYRDAHAWYKVPVNYPNAVYQAGGLPLIFPCDPDPDKLKAYIGKIDGMLFCGGDDYPPDLYGEEPHAASEFIERQRAETDVMLMRMLLEDADIPILAICAGHQLLAIASGAKLIQHIDHPEMHGHRGETTHPIDIIGGKWLKTIFNAPSIVVNSYHHQAVRRDDLPSALEISAASPDGLIEAMEYRGKRFILGVQWHPERIRDTNHKKMLFEFFINMTRERTPTA